MKGSSLAARECKKSCRRLRFARELSSGALGCHNWTSHSRDTPTRGHRVRPRFMIKVIQGVCISSSDTRHSQQAGPRERAFERVSRRHVQATTKSLRRGLGAFHRRKWWFDNSSNVCLHVLGASQIITSTPFLEHLSSHVGFENVTPSKSLQV